MKNFFLMKFAKYFISRIDGYKTILGGLSSFVMGITYGITLLVPDINPLGIEPTVEMTIGYFTGAFTIWGIGGKLEKSKKEMVVTKNMEG